MPLYKGKFCNHYSRRTLPNKDWCKEIILKDEYAKLQKEEFKKAIYQ